jgi:hypothetical protein
MSLIDLLTGNTSNQVAEQAENKFKSTETR